MMLPALVMYLWSPALASEAHNDLGSCRCCLTLLPETTRFLCVLPASVGHRDLPHYLLSLSCSLIRTESFSVDKYLRVPLNQLFFWMTGGAAAQLFFLVTSVPSVTLSCFLFFSYQFFTRWYSSLLLEYFIWWFKSLSCCFPMFGGIVWLKTLQGGRRM